MNSEEKIFYIKTLHKALNIPILYSAPQQKTHYFYPFPITQENDERFISQRLYGVLNILHSRTVLYHLHKSLVMFGLVVNRQTNELVFVGPLLSSTSTEKDIADYLFESGMSSETTKIMTAYLLSSQPFSLDKLHALLRNINLILNGNIIPSEDVYAIYDQDSHEKTAYAQKTYSTEPSNYEQLDTVLVDKYNQQLNYCVQTGDLDRLAVLIENLGIIPYAENSSVASLKELKMTAFGSVFAVEAEALKSGIPKADLDKTKQYYLERIENSRNPNEMHTLTISSLFDFTRLVRENLKQKTNNPTIDRAINYIKTNINSKLLAEDIARALHVNLHYLFMKFKAETGKTLIQYVNEEKIKKSCYYLRFTDKTLVDIAMHLSFSSQSYYQSVFKKIMGVTPTKWREKTNNI